MCGLAGVLRNKPLSDNSESVLENMGLAIFSRGPDSSGVWTDQINGIGLVHRRLAILDLTEAGHQPMHSVTGRYIIAFNGEIYNHLDVRGELEHLAPRSWRGHSDTETLLTAIEVWGLADTLKRCVGMFAVALWDTVDKKLFLARDRFGEKPLYYGFCSDGSLVFGSELKSFRAHPDFKAVIDRDSLANYLRYNYVPAPKSIYKDVYKVEPATILEFDTSLNLLSKVCYWDAVEKIQQNMLVQFDDSDTATKTLEKVLKHTVKEQMLADVPLGAFLSGGVDSSLIVSLMKSQTDVPVKTFSIGFNEEQFNEAVFAAAVARHLDTEHTELIVTADDALQVVDKIAAIYDEPFSDSSQIPTFLVSELASKHVTVCLSGDAGDELFCGYNRYLMTKKVWKWLSKVPLFGRKWMAAVIKKVSIESWNKVNRLLPASYKMSNLGDKLHKAANVIDATNLHELYLKLISIWQAPETVVLGAANSNIINNDARLEELDSIAWMMATDTLTYMSGDILAKVDRAAMAVSLETRVPFLDHRVFELAWRIPLQQKVRGTQGKIPLREILYKYVPKELIERPKTGFGIPVAEWLRGGLKSWAEQLINKDRLKEEGFFDPEVISIMWKEHQEGTRNWHYQLWAILMFQNWYEKNHK
ncbi:asparagine synthase (glutamine-hydrolyzing) [Rheinheimera hassiensis]|uniref:asparagine synthase (glutamine-hydrolyzing) n=1 Tax=Rheinheimera hassiensis TaxID=1193627 RepID=UPI001F05B091|nr:asparagine synthase (glutamine-hydrolyzing) [Rheinheimera hassiensis]